MQATIYQMATYNDVHETTGKDCNILLARAIFTVHQHLMKNPGKQKSGKIILTQWGITGPIHACSSPMF